MTATGRWLRLHTAQLPSAPTATRHRATFQGSTRRTAKPRRSKSRTTIRFADVHLIRGTSSPVGGCARTGRWTCLALSDMGDDAGANYLYVVYSAVMSTLAVESYRAFWSYTHKDNGADSGRIVQLAHDIADEYGLLTSADMDLFLDIEEVQWGEELLPSISAALAEISFFLPVVTPRYFKSEPCRKELQEFYNSADALGLRELILPILYVDVSELHDTNPSNDPLINIIKERKWFDWRHLRLSEPSGADYRSAVNEMAERIRTATASAQNANLTSGPHSPMEDGDGVGEASSDQDDDAPGPLDRMAAMEEALPLFSDALTELNREIVAITGLTETWGQRFQEAPTLRARLQAVKKFASILQPYSDRVVFIASRYAEQLNEVDYGLTVAIQQAAAEFPSASAENKKTTCELFASISSLVQASREGLAGLQSMADSVEAVEGMSKDVRPPLRTLRRGLLLTIGGGTIIEGWSELIEAADVDCDLT